MVKKLLWFLNARRCIWVFSGLLFLSSCGSSPPKVHKQSKPTLGPMISTSFYPTETEVNRSEERTPQSGDTKRVSIPQIAQRNVPSSDDEWATESISTQSASAQDSESKTSPRNSSIADDYETAKIDELPGGKNNDVEFVPIPAAFFCFDESDIWKKDHPSLIALTQCYKSPDVGELIVIGHADSRGSEEYNNELSKRRAGTVADYFKAKLSQANKLLPEPKIRACEPQPTIKGNSSGRLNIEIQACGESQLEDEENSKKAHARNRRVEIIAPTNDAIIAYANNQHFKEVSVDPTKKGEDETVILSDLNEGNLDETVSQQQPTAPPTTTPSMAWSIPNRNGPNSPNKPPVQKQQTSNRSKGKVSSESASLKGIKHINDLAFECTDYIYKKIKQIGSKFETEDRQCQKQRVVD